MKDKQNDIIQRVAAFANEAHAGQMRKYTGEKYIEHLLRVMRLCNEYVQDTAVLSAALLHDTIEDTAVDKKTLEEFLSGIMEKREAERTLKLVVELTDVYVKVDYPDMNRRVRRGREAERLSEASPEAQTIKYADIIDNVQDLGDVETDFAPVFMRECKEILKQMNRGNQELYQRAVRAVDDGLKKYFSRVNIKAL